jgi:endoglucanase Acf2
MSDEAKGSDESTRLTSRVPRQQYHYVYGSSSAPSHHSDRNDRSAVGACSPITTDQDSLVGEGLILTDNEQDDEKIIFESEGDFQQLLMSNGNGVHVLGDTCINETTKSRNVGRGRRNLLAGLGCQRSRKSQPVLYLLTVAGTASLFVIAFTVIFLYPGHWTRSKSDALMNMPFQRVDRGGYGDPVSGFIDKTLFDPTFINRRGRSSSREFIFPFPTGSFWTNFVLSPTADRGLSYPVVVYPYAYAWSQELLQVSYPAAHRHEEPTMIHDYFFPDLTFSSQEGAISRHVTHFDALSVTLRYSTAQAGKWETYLVQGSPYVTIRYDNASPIIHAPSTFTNVGCSLSSRHLMDHDARFRLRRLGDQGFGVCTWDEDSTAMHRVLRGVQFRVTSQEGMEWIVFSSEPIELQFDLESKSTISAVKKFKGVLRIALIPTLQPAGAISTKHAIATTNVSSTNSSASNGLQRLIYHAGVYPISGGVSWSFRAAEIELRAAALTKSIIGQSMPEASYASSAASRIGTLTFEYGTDTFTASSSAAASKPLLMLALPHHAQTLPTSMQLGHDEFDLVYECIKGPMRPALGRVWSYEELLPSLGFDDFDLFSNQRTDYLDPHVRATIAETLMEDIRLALPTLTENVYGFGKQTSRLAQLAHIALMLRKGNKTDHFATANRMIDDGKVLDIDGVYSEAVVLLRDVLEHFLNSTVSDSLLYDENLGGLVSSDGLRDTSADFGNGRYNDHHFHYGYLLYSCAVLGNIDKGFLTRHGEAVDAIYRDIAHDKNFKSEKSDDLFFPGARHKVWFDGHSFASGLFPFGNGKSQESSSEAVNGYFGAYLWSLVRHESLDKPELDVSPTTDFARLLLATEIRGAKTYWHMVPPSDDPHESTSATSTVYSPAYSKNYMVGNLGMLDAVSSTWFGTSSLYVHMINEMPVTAITSELFDAQFVEEEHSKIIAPLRDVEMAWRGYVVCNQALVDPVNAWKQALALESRELDSGVSKSFILYFIATREAFDAAAIQDCNLQSALDPHLTAESATSKFPSTTGGSECANHVSCHLSGLIGHCCPTSAGLVLECCSK